MRTLGNERPFLLTNFTVPHRKVLTDASATGRNRVPAGGGFCSAPNAGRALTFIDQKVIGRSPGAVGGGGEVTVTFLGFTVSDLVCAGLRDITVLENTESEP